MLQYLKYILLALLAYLLYFVLSWTRRFHLAIQAAKSSNIPYVVVPLYFLNFWWLLSHRLFFPLLKRLPRKYTTWVDLCLPDFSFDYSHEVFSRVGSDTFMTVAAGGRTLYTADPAVITQITTRRNDFPKPTAIYKSVDIYGKNVVSTEGQEWRFHRKATSPPFTEKNNHLVWSETITQAQAMLGSWVGSDGRGGKTVDRVMDDTMRLSLHVISRAGFGRHVEWPTEETKSTEDTAYTDPSKIKNETDAADRGHQMSYTYAIHCLLDNILFQFLLPRWALKYGPLAALRKANTAYEEWGAYMAEMVAAKKQQLQFEPAKAGGQMDIIGQLVKGQVAEQQQTKNKDQRVLTDEEILGNSFILILAGHETAANSIHFAILYLALFPASQRRLQQDLDGVFHGLPPSEWKYETHLPLLFGGMTGAVLNEELRLCPPVINIPKCTFTVPDQPITINGKQCTIPAGTYITLCSAAVHKNPKYWPTSTSTASNPGGRSVHPVANTSNDLEEFRPERWLLDQKSQANGNGTAGLMPSEKIDSENLGVNESSDTSDTLFRPPKGAYIPFSDGHRACLGRRFAQVEVLVTLAVLFQNYSVELAVDDYASDQEVDGMNETEKAEVWQLAAEKARDLMLNGMGVVITLQMRAGAVKVRFVPRGKERFGDDVDEKGRRYGLKPGEVGVPDTTWRSWAGGERQEVPVK